MRYGLPLDTLALSELDWTLRVLVREAVRLRANVDQFDATGAPYAHYAE